MRGRLTSGGRTSPASSEYRQAERDDGCQFWAGLAYQPEGEFEMPITAPAIRRHSVACMVPKREVERVKTISREELYEQVWSKPMIKVAADYDVTAVSESANSSNELDDSDCC